MKLNIFLTIVAIAGLVLVWKISEPSNNNYNDYMCAIYGKDIECNKEISKAEQHRRIQLYLDGQLIREHITNK